MTHKIEDEIPYSDHYKVYAVGLIPHVGDKITKLFVEDYLTTKFKFVKLLDPKSSRFTFLISHKTML